MSKGMITGIAVVVIIILVGLLLIKSQGSNSTSPQPTQNTSANTPQPTQTATTATSLPTQTNSTSTSSSPSAMTSEQNTVTLTSTGFSPPTLTIKAGQTVTWLNKIGEDATVNSNPHPVHTDYPPLNLGRFSDGQTLNLTFDKPGTYGYHDHLNPNLHGQIIVQ